MPISVVQTKTSTSGTSTSFASATTAGNCVVVVVFDSSSTGFAPAPTVTAVKLGGAAGNFSQLASGSLTDRVTVSIWADPNCAGGQTAIAITETNGNAPIIVAYEVSGIISASVLDKSSTGTGTSNTQSSGTTATTTQANELWIGGTANFDADTQTGPGGWTNTAFLSNASQSCGMAGYQIVSATGTATYTTTTSAGTPPDWAAAIVTLKGIGNISVALPVAQFTVAAPPPGPAAGPIALTVAQETIAAPAPAAGVSVPLAAAQVTVAAQPVLPPVSLPAAQVTVAAPAVTPVVGIVVPLPVAQVTITAWPPAVSGDGVALPVAQVTAAAWPPGLSIGKNIPLVAAQVTAAALPVTPSVNVHVALSAAQETITAYAPLPSRQLLISLASKAGTDDYGTSFPLGIMASAGLIKGPEFAGTEFIITTAGAFFYTGTPGAGNLAISVVPGGAPVSDPFGNTAQPGVAVYSGSSYALFSTGQLAFSDGSNIGSVSGTMHMETTSGDAAIVLNDSFGTINLDGNHVNVNGNDLTRIFGLLQPGGYPLSPSATTGAIVATLNSAISILIGAGIFS